MWLNLIGIMPYLFQYEGEKQ
ncbi:hypothetical protein QN277_014335 [Acacia crassicarpa]|uniref:Uncharacterized protein n=1 Tax=Acacia crassicarpa TaxID=499986 RepID=A0AAE1IPB3_9FABA|nr:hypothetical protein QN277_014335 [Acacia crassicarpa]